MPDRADAYVATMRRGVDHLADALRGVTGPATGVAPERAAGLVADVDLDRPLGDEAAALAEMSRIYLDDAVWFHEPTYAAHLNCPVVLPALLAEVFVSALHTDVFDGFLRHLAAILDEDGVLDVDTFWAEVARCLAQHEDEHPDLAAAAASYDFFRPEFRHSCLNRLQLRNTRQRVDLSDQAESLMFAWTLRNPIAGPDRVGPGEVGPG